ncbi:MAG: hypothetical protein ACR2GD_02645 [Pyrinomonadaceae bacterium]
MKVIIFAIIIAATLTFSATGQTKEILKNTLNNEDIIREIIFKKILPEKANIGYLRDFYLSVNDGKNPSNNLLKQFDEYQKKNQVRIKKVSESFISRKDGDSVLNKLTKKQGIIYSVSKLDWKNKDEVKVSAGSYIGNMGSDTCTYILKRKNGVWKIINAEGCVVS